MLRLIVATECRLPTVQVIEIDPSNSHAYHNRGISYDKLGRFELAIADFSKGTAR